MTIYLFTISECDVITARQLLGPKESTTNPYCYMGRITQHEHMFKVGDTVRVIDSQYKISSLEFHILSAYAERGARVEYNEVEIILPIEGYVGFEQEGFTRYHNPICKQIL